MKFIKSNFPPIPFCFKITPVQSLPVPFQSDIPPPSPTPRRQQPPSRIQRRRHHRPIPLHTTFPNSISHCQWSRRIIKPLPLQKTTNPLLPNKLLRLPL